MSIPEYDKARFGLEDPPPNNCIFCRVIAGELSAYIVARTPGAMAFLDNSPVATGHTLVIPRTHSPNLLYAHADDLSEVIWLAQIVSRGMVDSLGIDGVSMWQANGVAGGQTVAHTHFHIVPREVGDLVLSPLRQVPRSTSPLAPIAEKLADAISKEITNSERTA